MNNDFSSDMKIQKNFFDGTKNYIFIYLTKIFVYKYFSYKNKFMIKDEIKLLKLDQSLYHFFNKSSGLKNFCFK